MKYELVCDGKVVCTLEDEKGINPVYAAILISRKLTEERERMMEEDSQPRME